MGYIRLQVLCASDYSEILIAEIAEAGFDMFLETENGFEAHAEEHSADLKKVAEIKEKYSQVDPFTIVQDFLEKKNWNEEWENNVSPIIIEDQCLVRAGFHKTSKTYPYEIIITPKMSFGTGHHQTTHLMLKRQLQIDHQGKRVMDAGCGTAILSVMACKRGAAMVEAFDIDEWSMSNGMENAELNQCPNIRIRQGTIESFSWPEPFEIVLANINKNVLLNEMKLYARHLVPGGLLLLSGFYVADIPDLASEADRFGLTVVAQDERAQWATLQLLKFRQE